MSSDRSLGLFGKLILVYLYFLLWMQFGSEFKYQTIADDQLLPPDEADALRSVLFNLGLETGRKIVDTAFCNTIRSSEYYYDYDLGINCNCSFNNKTLCHIDIFSWRNKGLKGFLSEAVAGLSFLERLDLSANEIQGSIPSSLGNLSRLYYLDLSNNQLTGAIPPSLGNLKVGTRSLNPSGDDQICPIFNLDLSNNYLNGSIPESLGNIKLDHRKKSPPTSCNNFVISLGDNYLTGSIPKSFRNLKYLTTLYLQRNLLSGPITSLCGMLSLFSVSLSENEFNGSLPPQLGNLTSLQYLWLDSNYFIGDFPRSYGQLHLMITFSISGNYLSGPFPAVITNWTKMYDLSIDGNHFRGNIPLEIFSFSDYLTFLRIGDVDQTASFQLPESIAPINILVLRNCSVTGYIPKTFDTYMSYLDLSFNKLTGVIPDSLGNFNLSYMSFANNLLRGPIPAWVSRAATWTKIDLSFNSFSNASVELHKNPNVNLFSCCKYCNPTNCEPEMRDVDHLMMQSCRDEKPKSQSLYINCGGEQIDVVGKHYDQDNSTSSSYGVSSEGNWAFTSSGGFTSSSDYIKKTKCGISVNDAPLYDNARVAPVSLKYYGYCLHNDTYNVTLHFAEIVNTKDDEVKTNDTNYPFKKRIFDVYIQGERVRTNFNINCTAGGPNKIALVENHTTVVNNSQLEIHLYWAGKGSIRNSADFNGPLLSAISVTPAFPREKKLSRSQIALITIASIISALLLLLAFAWIMGWLEKEEMHDIKVNEDKTVTLKQLMAATRRFSQEMEIGKGGFGTVYKAELPDHQIVAVKKLFLSDEGIDKLKNEIYNLQSLRHENLVRLFDIHVGKSLCFLVYEYMENKSLADVLFDPEHKIKLEWETRFNICLGVAKGLEYLHERPRQKMVHRGVKAANILLDGTFKSKISDFGLASTYAESDNDATQFLRVMKTEASNGYMAPEYPVIGKESSYKYDVYGFGVVLLEIVCGKKNVSPSKNNRDQLEILVDEVWIADTKGRLLDLLDKNLATYETRQVLIVLKLAVKCTSISPGVRPTMSQVVSVLMNEKTLEEISEPAHSKEADILTKDTAAKDFAKDAEYSSASA